MSLITYIGKEFNWIF